MGGQQERRGEYGRKTWRVNRYALAAAAQKQLATPQNCNDCKHKCAFGLIEVKLVSCFKHFLFTQILMCDVSPPFGLMETVKSLFDCDLRPQGLSAQ